MKELTEQEEKELYAQYKSTFKEKIVDGFYSLIEKADNGLILIAAMCTVLGIFLLTKLF